MQNERGTSDSLFAEHIAGIASYCRWHAGSPNDAQDAVIETHSTFWFLASQVKSPTVKNKSFLFLTINPRSHEIERIRVGQPDPAVTARMQVKTLLVSPTLPMPTPACTPA
jgi:hypothetical protein